MPGALNDRVPGTDVLAMTTALDDVHRAARHGLPVADVTALLPTREALVERLTRELPAAAEQPTSLIVLGLLRRDDGWPTARSTLAGVTSLVARSIRGDDWVAACGPGEFGIVLVGSASSARTAALRLVSAIPAQGTPGLAAAAGVAPVDADLPAAEIFRRATLSLTAARRVGRGTVIQYREPL